MKVHEDRLGGVVFIAVTGVGIVCGGWGELMIYIP